MAHSLKDPILVKAKDSVEKKLPAELKEPVERTVLAGMKLLYDQKTHQSIVMPVYTKLKENNFAPEQIANGMINFLGVLFKASGGGMKIEAAFPAGVILLCYVLDDLEQNYGLKVTPELLKSVGEIMTKKFAALKDVPAGNAAQPGAPNPASAPPEPPGLAGTVPPPQGATP